MDNVLFGNYLDVWSWIVFEFWLMIYCFWMFLIEHSSWFSVQFIHVKVYGLLDWAGNMI